MSHYHKFRGVWDTMVNLLVPYVPLPDHHDPMLDEFTYGDIGSRARKLKNEVENGDYIFFHTTVRGLRYITAYYVTDRVLKTEDAALNKAIVAKYHNPHISEYLAGERREGDDAIVFGDPILSKKLQRPLRFDKNFADKLSLDIRFKKGFTENQCISSATRAWRELPESDVNVLLRDIERNEKEGFRVDTVLSTDEVLEIQEADLENFIVRNSELLGSGLVLKGRQVDTSEGRIDLLFEDKSKNLVVVELKLGDIGKGALNQLRGYMHNFRKSSKVRGVLVCKDILPAFVDEFEKLRDVQVFCFGWKLVINPRKWE